MTERTLLMKARILFLMSDTGGGHRAAAQAIEEAIHFLYPNSYETIIEDIWRCHTPWPINRIPASYTWFTNSGRPLWKLLWSGSARIQAHKKIFPSLSPVLERRVICYLRTIRPEIVVSVHPFMNHLGLRWLGKAKLDIPFVTVVTDMVTIHPLWICPQVTRCLVPTELAADQAAKLGMPANKIELCGQPVGLKFLAKPPAKKTVRRKLGLDLKRRTVMVMGGGEGNGRVFDIARALAQKVPQAQLVIVAGRNRPLKEKLDNVAWEIPTRIYGFVDNIPELMAAADLLITKAGPGTLSEAFAAGLPPLISSYIPGQEEGNVAYAQEHQAGAYAETPDEIASLVLNWMDPDDNTLYQMARNARKLAKPEAALAIASTVCSLISYPYQSKSLRTPYNAKGLLPDANASG
jgi:1,2-diacylglycerol 3-beta-galactosyltransferase